VAAKENLRTTQTEFDSVLEKYTAAQKAYDDFLQAEKDAKTTSKAKNLLQQRKTQFKEQKITMQVLLILSNYKMI
jgi:type III secretory pathway component EscR